MVKLTFKTHHFGWFNTIISLRIHFPCVFFSWFGTHKSSKSFDHFSIETHGDAGGSFIFRDPQLLQPFLFHASHGISHGAVCLVALCLSTFQRVLGASARGAAGGAAGVEPKATRMGREGHGRRGRCVQGMKHMETWGFWWIL